MKIILQMTKKDLQMLSSIGFSKPETHKFHSVEFKVKREKRKRNLGVSASSRSSGTAEDPRFSPAKRVKHQDKALKHPALKSRVEPEIQDTLSEIQDTASSMSSKDACAILLGEIKKKLQKNSGSPAPSGSQKTGFFEQDVKIYEEAVESGTELNHASNNDTVEVPKIENLSGFIGNSEKAENVKNSQLEFDFESELKCCEMYRKSLNDLATFLVENDASYLVKKPLLQLQFDNDILDTLCMKSKLTMKSARDAYRRLSRMLYYNDINNDFVKIAKRFGYYIEETHNKRAVNGCLKLNAFERGYLQFKLFNSIYFKSSGFPSQVAGFVFIPNSLLDNLYIRRILNLKHYNSFIKQLLCIFVARVIFNSYGSFTNRVDCLKQFEQDLRLLETGRFSNSYIIHIITNALVKPNRYKQLYINKKFMNKECNKRLLFNNISIECIKNITFSNHIYEFLSKKI